MLAEETVETKDDVKQQYPVICPTSENIETPSMCLFSAKRNSGKTHLMKHLIYVMAKSGRFNRVIIMSSTAFNGEWNGIIPAKDIHTELDVPLIERLLKSQSEHKEKMIKSKRVKPHSILLLVDDMMGISSMHDKILTRLACSGRHFNITVFIACQLLSKIPNVIRNNADSIFLLNATNDKMSKMLFEDASPDGFERLKDFTTFLREHAKNYCVVRINLLKSGEVSLMKAPDTIPQFTIRAGAVE